MKEFELGAADAHGTLPAEVDINGAGFFLTKLDGQYLLLSRNCPHAGGEVQMHETMFYCPLHMWTFNKRNGECLTVPGACLDQFPVVERDGKLVAVFG